MDELICVEKIAEPVKGYVNHKYHTWQIIYYTYGKGITTVKNIEFQFQPKTIICIPPDIEYFEASKTGYKNINISVNGINELGDSACAFKDTKNSDFSIILNQLHNEFILKQNNWEAIAFFMLNVLLQYLFAWKISNNINRLIQKFCDDVEANISNQNFLLKTAFNNLPISLNYFKKLFSQRIGKTPTEYLLKKRLEHAKTLLSSSNISGYKIKDISALCGFRDQYYFSRAFKKYLNVSPEKWVAK